MFLSSNQTHSTKILWEERFDNPPPTGHVFGSVYTIADGILCEIQRPGDEEERKENTNGFQIIAHIINEIGKSHRYGYLYLLLVRATDGKIVRFYGPHRGAANNLNVVYDSTFLQDRIPNEWTFGDTIFKCLPNFVATEHGFFRATPEDKFVSYFRSTIEHINSRLKNFMILHHPFRQHSQHKHELVFYIICQLVNTALLYEPIQVINKYQK